MHGELVLRDAPLSEVASELGRWYDGEVRLGDSSLTEVPLTASFAAESFREAIGVIVTVAPVRAVWRGRTVTLYRR
jgi:ferric-dicitrate binding protein FerR (iron transport regulator)